MIKFEKTTKTIALLVGATFIAIGAAQAAGHLGAIKKRQEAMKAVGGGMKIIVGTAKGKIPFDAANINKAAMTIKANLLKAKTLFPDGTDTDAAIENRAKPEIWLDEEGFAAAFKTAVAGADNMAGVTMKADLLPALGKLGGGCKGCHEKFRAPKK